MATRGCVHKSSSSVDAGTNSTYVIAGGRGGRDRLRVLSSALADSTRTFLTRLDIARDARILDLGCGGGDVTRMLAEAAPHGMVTGVDFDPTIIAIATEELATGGIDNVEFLVGDVTGADSSVLASIADAGPFDVVYARFLLSHLADPATLVGWMAQWCASTGVVAVEDIDIGGSICAPPHEAFDRACEIYEASVRARGGDPEFGLRLPVMLHDAGLRDVGVSIAQPGGLQGEAKHIQLITLDSIAPNSIALGLTTADEIAELTTSLAEHVDRHDTFVTTARVVQAWARR